MDNLELWNKVKLPPIDAMKKIGGGRLKGFTNIEPQWRFKVLTEHFGPCGIGWHYTIDKLWTVPGAEEQIVAFAQISLFYKDTNEGWSEPIPGIGGAFLIEKERNGPHTSDEAYKMAVTDALGVACKALGIGSDVYENKVGKTSPQTKYDERGRGGSQPPQQQGEAPKPWQRLDQCRNKLAAASEGRLSPTDVLAYVQSLAPAVKSLLDLNTEKWGGLIAKIVDGSIDTWIKEKKQ